MNASSSSAPSPFMRLPIELKARIVEMVRWQDAACRGELKQSFKWYGKGIKALRLTNRELGGLAADYLFRSIRTRNAFDWTFRSSIVPRFSRHVQEVELFEVLRQSMGKDDIRQLFQLVSGLPNLRSVRFDAFFLSRLLEMEPFLELKNGRSPASSVDEDCHMGTQVVNEFQALVSRLSTIHFETENPEAAAKLLEWSPNVQDLSLSIESYIDNEDGDDDEDENRPWDLTPIVQALATLSELTQFTLLVNGRVEVWPALNSSTPHNLRSLNIYSDKFGGELWRFVCQFANLEELNTTIDAYEPEKGLDLTKELQKSTTVASPLGRLRRLVVIELYRASLGGRPFTDFFFADPAPSPLVEVELHISPFARVVHEAAIAALEHTPTTLRRLDWRPLILSADSSASHPLNTLTRIRTICTTFPRNIHLAELDKQIALQQARPSSLDESQELLDWAKMRWNGLKVAGDEVAAGQMLEAMKGLKDLQEMDKQ